MRIASAAWVWDDLMEYTRDHDGQPPPWLDARLAELPDAEVEKFADLVRTHVDIGRLLG